MPVVYLNGGFLPLEEARISVLDRGFTFSDGVYEVLPVFHGKIFRLDEHLERLENSLAAIRITNPHTREQWKKICLDVLGRNRAQGKQSIYIQVTRGVGDRDHVFNNALQPTVFAMCKPGSETNYRDGIRAITHEDIRWQYCYIKSTALLAGVLLRQRAIDTDGSREAILIRNGRVTEGAASNVFIVRQGVITTPGKDGSILPGITRDLVVELLRNSEFGCIETDITEQELRTADEIWITSSTIGIVAVLYLDGTAVGGGRPGKTWEQADTIYQSYIKKSLIFSD
jgi:D-alanine transaminase